MLGFEALRLGDAWNIGLACLHAVTGPAKDLKVVGFVCPTKGDWEDVINVPSLSGLDDYATRLACPFPI